MAKQQRRWLFYDLETTGLSPAMDQVLGYAWILTDADLRPLERVEGLVRVRPDVIPSPGATMVHGLSPKSVNGEGVLESEFIGRFRSRLLSQEGTHSVTISGYNTIGFDDEFIRHALYRNLLPPYDHEWRGSNRRCDVYGMVQLARAWNRGLRFRENEDGRPDARLIAVAQENGIDLSEDAAHDALADVEATVEVARRIRRDAPDLFEAAAERMTDKKRMRALLADANVKEAPLWLTSRRLPGGGSLVYPLCADPVNRNKYYVVDLAQPPDDMLDAGWEEIREVKFKPAAQRSSTDPVMPCTTVEVNRMPLLEPYLPDEAAHLERAARAGIDLAQCQESLARVRDRHASLSARLIKVHDSAHLPAPKDPVYGGLYAGGFIPDPDRERLEALRSPMELGNETPRIANADLRAYWPAGADPRMFALSLRHKWSNHGREALGRFPEEERLYACHLYVSHFGRGREGEVPPLAAFRQAMAEERVKHGDNPVKQQLLDDLDAHVSAQTAKVRAFAERHGVSAASFAPAPQSMRGPSL